jgi:hypothetical protein
MKCRRYYVKDFVFIRIYVYTFYFYIIYRGKKEDTCGMVRCDISYNLR